MAFPFELSDLLVLLLAGALLELTGLVLRRVTEHSEPETQGVAVGPHAVPAHVEGERQPAAA